MPGVGENSVSIDPKMPGAPKAATALVATASTRTAQRASTTHLANTPSVFENSRSSTLFLPQHTPAWSNLKNHCHSNTQMVVTNPSTIRAASAAGNVRTMLGGGGPMPTSPSFFIPASLAMSASTCPLASPPAPRDTEKEAWSSETGPETVSLALVTVFLTGANLLVVPLAPVSEATAEAAVSGSENQQHAKTTSARQSLRSEGIFISWWSSTL
mmetsp:Transcript_126512/g.252815  ORF Transcript_126512/g.252815 Transcript_126512/m.252815 type:complete len:214 (-) Transcript_126512:50-691(-)